MLDKILLLLSQLGYVEINNTGNYFNQIMLHNYVDGKHISITINKNLGTILVDDNINSFHRYTLDFYYNKLLKESRLIKINNIKNKLNK